MKFNVGKIKKNLIKILAILPAMLVIPLVQVISAHLILCQSVGELLNWIVSMWQILLMEWVMLGILGMVAYGIFGRLYLSNILVSVPYILLTLISYYKSVINGTPLLLGDFKMAGQFMEIAKFAIPQIKFSAYTWCGVIFPFALSAGLLAGEKGRRSKVPRLAMLAVSAVLVLVMTVTPAFCNWAVAIDNQDKFQEQRVADYGPFMGMYCTYAQGKKAGEIYTEDAILRVAGQVPEGVVEEAKTPTVIFLMSESFFDVTKLENVTFKPDPAQNFHKLKKSYQSGDFLSSAYCGGTGYVEMEVITGICSNLLKSGDTLTYLSRKDVYKKIPAITDVFKGYGYKTAFLHSYNNELYNRDKIYADFGFDDVLFENSFRDPEYSGGYISDDSLADKIITMYKEKGDKPLFLYAVSMENHQPYSGDKFDKSPVKIKSDKLDEEAMAVLDAYVTGVYDADRSLGRLTKFFSKQKEPVMMVFFGDHLPNLGIQEGDSVFTRLGYIDDADSGTWDSVQLKKMLSTDYLIWTNYKDEYQNSEQSSNFLGVTVMKRLGLLNMTDYYLWLSQRVVPDMLMYRSRLFVDSEGVSYDSVPKEHQQLLEDYRVATYDIIYGNNRIFKTKH